MKKQKQKKKKKVIHKEGKKEERGRPIRQKTGENRSWVLFQFKSGSIVGSFLRNEMKMESRGKEGKEMEFCARSTVLILQALQ